MTDTFHSTPATIMAIIIYIAIMAITLHDAFLFIGGLA